MSRATSLAAKQLAPHVAIMNDAQSSLGLAVGLLTPQEAALAAEARMGEIKTRYVLLELGQALSMIDSHHESARVLGAIAHAFTVDPLGARAAAIAKYADEHADPRSGLFEREVFTHWGQAVLKASPTASRADDAVHRLGVQRGVWAHCMQRPLDHFERSLTRKPFWDADELPAAQALEAAYADILGELQGLLSHHGGAEASFAEYHSRVVAAGSWSDVQLFAGCRRDRAHCELCPQTASIVAAQPRLNTVIFGSHFFSRLAPGTHLSRHCGPSNFRLRCHLALTVPPGVRIRVGDEVREWVAGKCLIFDDSFEHEVWHDGTDDRVVLICDLWHPEIVLDKHILPLLNTWQRESLLAAMRQQHIYLSERTYSTGATVARD